jgi:hypothetical protein
MATIFAEDVQVPADSIDVPTSTETLVVAGNALSWQSDHGKAVIRAWCELLVATGTTAVTLTIYRGPAIGGPVVGTKTPDAGDFTVGKTATFEAEFVDVLQDVGGAQYCLSVQQTGATGDGTVSAALIDTTILSG